MTVKDLAARVAELEEEIAELKKREPVESHYHSHYHYPVAQPQPYNPWPYYPYTVWSQTGGTSGIPTTPTLTSNLPSLNAAK